MAMCASAGCHAPMPLHVSSVPNFKLSSLSSPPPTRHNGMLTPFTIAACRGGTGNTESYLQFWAGNGLDDTYSGALPYLCEIEICPAGRYYTGGVATCTDCPLYTSSSVSGAFKCLPQCPVVSTLSIG